MSQVANCPSCGSKSKIKKKDGQIIYEAIQDEEVFKKVAQLKKAMEKFKEKAESLEKELEALTTNK
jgi:predicted transcriptional regulator